MCLPYIQNMMSIAIRYYNGIKTSWLNIHLPRNQEYGFSSMKSYHRQNFKYLGNLRPVVFVKIHTHPMLFHILSDHPYLRHFAFGQTDQHKSTFREKSAITLAGPLSLSGQKLHHILQDYVTHFQLLFTPVTVCI